MSASGRKWPLGDHGWVSSLERRETAYFVEQVGFAAGFWRGLVLKGGPITAFRRWVEFGSFVCSSPFPVFSDNSGTYPTSRWSGAEPKRHSS